MHDDIELPYEYSNNNQSFGMVAAIACTLATAALVATSYFHLYPIPSWTIFVPLGLLAIRVFFYTLIRNAVHEATRMADTDSRLDDIVIDHIETKKRFGLTPGFLNEQLIGSAE